MIPYNVDFFDFYSGSTIANVHHDVVHNISISDDYLSLPNSSVTINKTTNVKKNQLIYIEKDDFNFSGLVTEVASNDYQTTVTFGSFLNVFKQSVLIDVKKQSEYTTSGSLETFIYELIKKFWINTIDSLQNIKTFNLKKFGTTTNWSFGIKPNEEEGQYAIVDFYDSIISPALSKYNVPIKFVPNFDTMKLDVIIGFEQKPPKLYIDADQDNIYLDTLTLHDSSTTTNKLIVYNTENYDEYTTYFLHNDDNRTYTTGNYNRITPVVVAMTTATPVEEVKDDDGNITQEGVTFTQAAKEAADNEFSGIQWNNLIELNVALNDQQVRPLELEYGQEVVIYNETNGDGLKHGYTSVLTGKTISDRVELIFGTVRLDLTSVLKIGGK